MIAMLFGTVTEIAGELMTLNVNGVGYEVFCTNNCIEQSTLGKERELVVFTEVKEDSIRLYGFADKLEKQVFLLLTKVKGVGARSASDIVSRIDKRELLRAIGGSDVARLQAVRGIGRKTAERIVVELKDRVADFVLGREGPTLVVEKSVSTPRDDAVSALVALGFTRKDAERAVKEAQTSTPGIGAESSDIIREALRFV